MAAATMVAVGAWATKREVVPVGARSAAVMAAVGMVADPAGVEGEALLAAV